MIKTWQQRCEEHPDHEGIVTEAMIRERMQEEIDELRQALAEPEQGNSSSNYPITESNTSLDKIVEQAIQGHASTRDAIRWAVQQEREACAKIVEAEASQYVEPTWAFEIINDIKARSLK